MSKEINKKSEIFSDVETTTRIVAAFRLIPLALQDHYIAQAQRRQPFLSDINSARITEQYAAKCWEVDGAPTLPTTPLPAATIAELRNIADARASGKFSFTEAQRRANQLPHC